MSPTRTPRHKPKTLPPLIALIATLLATSLGLVACGGSSSTTTKTTNAAASGTTAATTTASSSTTTAPSATSTAGASEADAPRIATIRACLAKKGITLPQSHPLANAKLPKGMSRSQLYEQVRTCAGGLIPPNPNHFHRLPNGKLPRTRGFHNPFNNPRFHGVLAHFAACLRQQGIKVGEPNTSGKGPIFNTKGLNTGSPQFKAATAKCRSTLQGILQSTQAHPGARKAG